SERANAGGLSAVDNPHVATGAVEHARDLAWRFPPDGHFILNLGITAAPVDAALRRLIPGEEGQEIYFRSFPIRRLIHLGSAAPATRNLVLDAMLPPPELLAGRILIINRVLDEGRTMVEVLPPILSLAAQRRPDVRFGFYFVGYLEKRKMRG